MTPPVWIATRNGGSATRRLGSGHPLDEAGIAYIHMKSLGTPKLGREAARKGDTPTMTRIFEANQDKLDNPDLIYPGQVLQLP
mgnify:CR=1 FL=1